MEAMNVTQEAMEQKIGDLEAQNDELESQNTRLQGRVESYEQGANYEEMTGKADPHSKYSHPDLEENPIKLELEKIDLESELEEIRANAKELEIMLNEAQRELAEESKRHQEQLAALSLASVNSPAELATAKGKVADLEKELAQAKQASRCASAQDW